MKEAMEQDVSTEDVSQAILVEVRSILRSGWSVATGDSTLVIVGPDNSEFVSEVWHIARFIAYDQYVSIERQSGPGRAYKIASRSRNGLAFEVVVRASE